MKITQVCYQKCLYRSKLSLYNSQMTLSAVLKKMKQSLRFLKNFATIQRLLLLLLLLLLFKAHVKRRAPLYCVKNSYCVRIPPKVVFETIPSTIWSHENNARLSWTC